ncbi:polyprenol monophosphomannose synthase [Nocardioides sp. LMS-CY]|uniref:polyprenol monophosphomannose synthase n=1 Tax=Nocardioides sp. (strain LMS-CY) TaxID=2840457 RepID=UPI001BFFF11E|nr:polyprenol monophosphomannose synthase [Nocardioides sp. LMS-CY]QWF23670.1 polyprenol monophosphomannose synthase [Nocardioides sp. LMS-CY]
MRCVIVVPTYNEADTIGDLLESLRAVRPHAPGVSLEVLVVDDDSPDGTQRIVRAHPGFDQWVHLLARPAKDGLGAAYRAGFAAAVDAGYDAIVQMDADGSHPASVVPAMLELLRSSDVVVGSRYVAGGRTEGWPARRRALSWAANSYARGVLRLRTRDTTSGFRAWRTDAVTAAGVLTTASTGYGFQVENTWHAERHGLRLTELPITFTERTAGHSKMTGAVASEAASLVLRWRIGELVRAATTLRPPAAAPKDVAQA